VNLKKESDNFKQPTTLDEALEAKLDPVINAINAHVEKIYSDFNMALHKQMENAGRVESELSRMVQILWGIVNKANVRLAALESTLIKNGMSQKTLEEEIVKIEEELKKNNEWEELSLDGLIKDSGASPATPS